MKVYLQTSQLPITEKFEAINSDVPKNLICNFFMANNKNENSELSDSSLTVVVMHESLEILTNSDLLAETAFPYLFEKSPKNLYVKLWPPMFCNLHYYVVYV